VRPVGDHRVLHEAVAERIAIPLRVRARVCRGDRHVVDLTRRDPARDEALRSVRERRLELCRRRVALDLPEELVEGSARAAVAIRVALTRRAVAPTLSRAGGLDAGRGSVQLVRTLRAPRDVTQAGLVGLGQLQRVVEALAPPAEVDRLS